ncbi:MAG TPA: 2'-5' RNA ligase family protein [Sphingobium sp.]
MIAALEAMMGGVAGARWQSAAQLHLTLRFIGDVSGRLADDLALALPGAIGELPPFALSGVGYFERRSLPDAPWGASQPATTPRPASSQVRPNLPAGLEPEGPHLSTPYHGCPPAPPCRTDRPWIGVHADFALAPARRIRCNLVESSLTANGSHYEELASARPA